MTYPGIDRGHRLLDTDARPGISGTVYDTAWVASVPSAGDRRISRFSDLLALADRKPARRRQLGQPRPVHP